MRTVFFLMAVAGSLLSAPTYATDAGALDQKALYESMKEKLTDAEQVGRCQVEMVETGDSSFRVVLTMEDRDEPVNFSLVDPSDLNGRVRIYPELRSKAEDDPSHLQYLTFSQSDFFGYTHMAIGWEEDGDALSYLKLFKTTPLGKVYHQIRC